MVHTWSVVDLEDIIVIIATYWSVPPGKLYSLIRIRLPPGVSSEAYLQEAAVGERLPATDYHMPVFSYFISNGMGINYVLPIHLLGSGFHSAKFS